MAGTLEGLIVQLQGNVETTGPKLAAPAPLKRMTRVSVETMKIAEARWAAKR